MPKRTVYFSDDLDIEMRKRPDLPIATICQDAVREALKAGNEEPEVEARRLIRHADRLLTESIEVKQKRRTARASRKS
jgi:hypothetical protein